MFNTIEQFRPNQPTRGSFKFDANEFRIVVCPSNWTCCRHPPQQEQKHSHRLFMQKYINKKPQIESSHFPNLNP